MLLDRVFRRREAAKLATRITGQPISQTPGWLVGGSESSSGIQVTEERALTLSSVFSAVNRLARITAMLPLSVYRKEANGRREVASTHPAHTILHSSANPFETAFRARHRLEFFRLTWGNAYGEIGWDGAGRPRAMSPVEPWRVKPDLDDNGEPIYQIDGGSRTVAAGDMLHVPFVSLDGITGRGWLSWALDSIGIGIGSEEFAGRLYANDARPGGMLKHAGTPSKPARKEFREEWQEYHGGTKNRGKVGVLWGGWDWVKSDAFSPEQAQLLESRKFTVTEVARWLNMPPHLLADLDRATFSNIEQQSIEFVTYCLMSILVDYEQEYDRKLLSPPNLYSKHNVNGLLRGDMAARSQFYKDLFNIGVLSPNDILDLEDMNGVGAQGDQRFVPVNMAPLKQFLEPKPVVPPTPGPTPVPPPEPTPPAKQSLPHLNAEQLRDAMTRLLADTFTRLGRKEINEARRVSKDPKKFLGSWLEGHLRDFRETLTAAMRPVCEVATIGTNCTPGNAADYAAALWIADTQTSVLSAAECQSEEWPHRVEELLASWESDRADRAAITVMEVIHAGTN